MRYIHCVYFLSLYNLFFHSLIVFVRQQKFLICMLSKLFQWIMLWGSYPNFSLTQGHKYISFLSFSKLYSLGYTYGTFWDVYVQCYEVQIKVYFFLYGYPVVSLPFVGKTIIFPLNCLCIFVKNQLPSCVFISVLYSRSLFAYLIARTYCLE